MNMRERQNEQRSLDGLGLRSHQTDLQGGWLMDRVARLPVQERSELFSETEDVPIVQDTATSDCTC